MSSVGVICKDDYSGEARVFIEQGTAPFSYKWSSYNNELFSSQSYELIEEPLGVYNKDHIDFCLGPNWLKENKKYL